MKAHLYLIQFKSGPWAVCSCKERPSDSSWGRRLDNFNQADLVLLETIDVWYLERTMAWSLLISPIFQINVVWIVFRIAEIKGTALYPSTVCARGPGLYLYVPARVDGPSPGEFCACCLAPSTYVQGSLRPGEHGGPPCLESEGKRYHGTTTCTGGEMKDMWMLLLDSLRSGPMLPWWRKPVDAKCTSSSHVFYSSWSVPLPSLNCCPPEWLRGPSCPDLCWQMVVLHSQTTSSTLINECANYPSLLPAHLSN